MQRGGADRSSRVFMLALLAVLSTVVILYVMKRSELSTFQSELILAKSQATEVEEAFNEKIVDFQQQITTLEQKVANTRAQLDKCEDQLLTSDKDMEKKVVEMMECNKNLHSSQEALKGTKKDLEDVKIKNEKMTSEMSSLNVQLQSAHSTVRSCEQCSSDLLNHQTTLSQTKKQLRECIVECSSSNLNQS